MSHEILQHDIQEGRSQAWQARPEIDGGRNAQRTSCKIS